MRYYIIICPWHTLALSDNRTSKISVSEIKVAKAPARRKFGGKNGNGLRFDAEAASDRLHIGLLPHPQADERPVALQTGRHPFDLCQLLVRQAFPRHRLVKRHNLLDIAAHRPVSDGRHHPLARVGEAEVDAEGRIERGLAEFVFGDGQCLRPDPLLDQHPPQKLPCRHGPAPVRIKPKGVALPPTPLRQRDIGGRESRVIRQHRRHTLALHVRHAAIQAPCWSTSTPVPYSVRCSWV